MKKLGLLVFLLMAFVMLGAECPWQKEKKEVVYVVVAGSSGDEEKDVPLAPSNLTARYYGVAGGSDFLIEWTDNSNNEASFVLEAKWGVDGVYSEIGSVAENVTSTYYGTVPNPTQYYFRIRARNGDGYSPYSNEIQAVPL